MKEHGGWELGDSQKIQTGTKVKLVGFPNYSEGDTPYIEDCKVTSKKRSYRGEDIYTVSGRIVHGASGGVVLDDDYKVIGIIECGSNKFDDDEEILPGFIPINKVIDDVQWNKESKN